MPQTHGPCCPCPLLIPKRVPASLGSCVCEAAASTILVYRPAPARSLIFSSSRGRPRAPYPAPHCRKACLVRHHSGDHASEGIQWISAGSGNGGNENPTASTRSRRLGAATPKVTSTAQHVTIFRVLGGTPVWDVEFNGEPETMAIQFKNRPPVEPDRVMTIASV